jgi:aminoglycoside phosphotransferase (APT) family kinase protein
VPVIPIDEDDLYRRAQEVIARPAGSEIAPLVRLQGGTSSITYWTTFEASDGTEQKAVLKVAPAGLAPTKNRDVLRQARLQQALQGSGVPCPRVLGRHGGTPPEIPPFFVMAFEPGDCVEPSLAGTDPLPPAEVRNRELHAARILGTLHSLDPVSLNLGDEPEVTPEQELDRWTQSLAASDEDIRAGYEEIGDALAATVPAGAGSNLIHGDFRLGNTLSQGHEVVSVIDWEIWARSDARVDLGWFLMMCNPDAVLGRPIADGMPSNEELLATYEAARGTEVKDMHWFNALVRYKQAAISALIIRNARKRGESPPFEGPRNLLSSARAVLGG